MANIMDYLDWRGDLSFRVSEFNEIDNLIFTQIVYLDLSEIVPQIGVCSKISIKEVGDFFFSRYSLDEIEGMTRLKKNALNLLHNLMSSKRFLNCFLSNYVRDISTEEESQFSAMKVDLDDGSVFISFCGTDNTVVGWKENFNMSYLDETPGQMKAVEYVEKVMPIYKRRLRLGGHSKGGNLAVYAGMHSRKSIQNRILGIYNNDGPGFTKKMISKEGYQYILNKIHTILPQSSIVGMLLEHEESVEIIESINSGIMQHDAFSWQVKGTSFVRLDSLEEDSIFVDKTLKEWLSTLDTEQRQKFVDALFSILEKANISDTDQLQNMNVKQLMEVLKAIDGLSPESKDVLKKTIYRLLSTAGKMMKEIETKHSK